MEETIPRTLPSIESHTAAFWTGGESGKLLINQCEACQTFIHPPVPMCPHCHSRSVEAVPVSGKATVASYTVNHMPWIPNLAVPYIFAVAELIEQPGLRLSTEIVNVDTDAVEIGMPVRVVFERQEDIYLPLFEPA